MGIHRILAKTRLRYCWPTLNFYVIDWVKSCEPCSKRERPQTVIKTKLVPMSVPNEPFQCVSIDILGPFKPSKVTGSIYVLVFICYMKKYAELVPLQTIRATTIADALIYHVICRHGFPNVLHSDRCTSYLANIVRETCKLFNIKKTQTTSLHLECNGQSERMMSVISNSLAQNIDDEANWDSLIRFIQFAYNNSPCLDSTDYIPFFFIHGRHPRSLLDVNIDNFDIPITCRDYVISLMDNIENARTTAVETLKERKQQMKNKAYISTQEPSFTVGDIVYVYRPVVTHGRQNKIIRPWVAPFYIAQ